MVLPPAKPLAAVSAPRKIDLAEEMALHGVEVPQDIAEAVAANEPVFLGYQQRWFEDESQIMIAEKSRRTGLTWAEAGRNVVNAAKPKRRGGCNTGPQHHFTTLIRTIDSSGRFATVETQH